MYLKVLQKRRFLVVWGQAVLSAVKKLSNSSKDNFVKKFVLVLHLLKRLIGCSRGDLARILQRYCGMMKAQKNCFLFSRVPFMAQSYQTQPPTQAFLGELVFLHTKLGNRDFVFKFAEKDRRQHSVILLINDRSKLLVCHGQRRFYNSKFASTI